MKSIFLTYNQDSQVGKNTALRMQTISNLYGMSVNLPARSIGKETRMNEETARRIAASDVFVSFFLEDLTPAMKQEADHALQLKKPTLELYNPDIIQKVNTKLPSFYQAVPIDFENTDDTLHKVGEFIDQIAPTYKFDKKANGLSVALVGIGLGLLALWALNRVEVEA